MFFLAVIVVTLRAKTELLTTLPLSSSITQPVAVFGSLLHHQAPPFLLLDISSIYSL